MTAQQSGEPAASRREELLAIAAELFAERGFRNTTVRDIADAAGIETVYRIASFLPLLGVLAALLPRIEQPRG